MDLERTLRQALEFMQDGNLQDAERLFLDLLGAFPEEPNTSNFLGLLRRQQGRFREAEHLLRQAIDTYPDAGSFHNNLANVLVDQQRPDEAMDAYRSALRHEPHLREARTNLGNLCLQAGNRPEALKLASAGLAQAPGDLELLSLYGAVLGIGNPPSAAPLPSASPSPWLGSPFAFLAEPDWRTQGWKDLVEDFALSFAAWEPVSLILFLGSADQGLSETEALIRAVLAGRNLDPGSRVLAVPLDRNLPETLSRFPRAHWLHPDPAVLAGMEGHICVRLAARRYARAVESRQALPFLEALRLQVQRPVEGPPWAAAPMGACFLLQAAWPEEHLRKVLEAYLAAFDGFDPVVCLLLPEQGPGAPPPVWLQEYLRPRRSPEDQPGPWIHLVTEPERLVDHLRSFPKILRLSGPPGDTAGLEGLAGMRLAKKLHPGWHPGGPALRSAAPPTLRPPGLKLKILCFTSEAPRHATYRLRIGGPAWAHREAVELLEGLSIADQREGNFDFRKLEEADLILVQRFFPRSETRAFLDAIFSSGKPVLMETDDLVHCLPEFNPSYLQSTLARDFLLDTMARSTSLIVSTPALGEELAAFNPSIEVMPNLLDPRIWGGSPDPAPSPQGPVVIGYCGTPTHFEDLGLVEEALIRISEKHGDRVCFHFFGCVTPRLEQLPGTTVTGFRDGYEAYAGTLKAGGMHIAMAPLVDHAFNRCKSHIKWLEYSALGVAGVYSDLAPYQTAVRSGETGLLADAAPRSWFDALDHLVSDPDARRRMGQRARQEVLDRHTLGPASPWLGILERALRRGKP